MKLDKLIQITDLRQVWKNESTDFTPWLAKEENLALLGEAIGIDISLEEKESTVGDFSVDIFAKEEGTGRNIIIENQLEDTNHDHLGKLITYASGKNAEIVIWIVKRARDEHRKAIEWLNNHTDDTAAFFLIEIELWKIGDSQPAAKFNVVERPNDWAKAIKANTNLTAGEAIKLDFWQSFNAYAAEERPDFTKVFNLRKPQTWHWYDLSTGIGSVSVQYTVNTNNGKLTAGLTVFDEDHSLFEAFLEKDKELSELLGGAKIISKESVKSARLFIARSIKLKDKETWSEDFKWLCDCGLKLRDFARKIAK